LRLFGMSFRSIQKNVYSRAISFTSMYDSSSPSLTDRYKAFDYGASICASSAGKDLLY